MQETPNKETPKKHPLAKLFLKVLLFAAVVFAAVALINYRIDPANVFHGDVIAEMTDSLAGGKTVVMPGEINEGYFRRTMISRLSFKPETVVLGSSHVMYMDWDSIYPKTLNAGLPGAYLGDYYSVIGLLEFYKINPKRVIIGVDAWSFTRDALSPRHTNLKDCTAYGRKTVLGEKTDAIQTETPWWRDWDNLQELFSFPYFQSSMQRILEDGWNARKSAVTVCEDDTPLEDAIKVTPGLRYIMPQKGYLSLEQNRADAQKQIDDKNVYQLGKSYKKVSKDNFAQFEELIDYLQSKGIEVEFYLPAYFPSIYEHIQTAKDYAGIPELEEKIRELGKEKGITVHGTYDPQKAGITEEDFADASHMTPDKMLETYQVILEQ